MITKESELAVIEDWSELGPILFNEGIDTEAMTEDEQKEAIEVWTNDRTRYLNADLAGQEMSDGDTLVQLIQHFGKTRARTVPTFCPNCGNDELYETCPSNTYYTVRAVKRGDSIHTIADRQQSKPPSIDCPDLFRCEMCEFETESEQDLLRFGLIGGEQEGKVVIESGIRVELLFSLTGDDSRPRSAIKMDLHYPDAPAGWINVVDGSQGDCLTVPVAMNDDATRKEIVMRRAAEEVKARLLKLERSQTGFAGIYDGWQIAIGNFTSIEEALVKDEALA